jgi:hypothetical protein
MGLGVLALPRVIGKELFNANGVVETRWLRVLIKAFNI